MESPKLSQAQLKKEIYKLRRELRDDMSKIRSALKSTPNIPTDALKKMQDIEKTFRVKSIKDMEKKELQSVYRQLRYIRGLRTSKLGGAVETMVRFSPIKEKLDSLSKEKRDEFWGIYGALYSEFSGMSKYKYEILQTIDRKFGDEDSEDIFTSIYSLYTSILEKYDGDISDEELKLLFTKKLKKI